jgi:hypothetical protein
VPAIVSLAVLAPALAQAQTNIDQGQSAAQLFAADCAVCHKSVRALANGKNSLTLSSFLTEHYTSSRQEASALAAYVLGGGVGSGAVAQPRGPTPVPERAGAPPAEGGTRQARRSPKPEEGASPSAKLPRPAGDDAKPAGQPSAAAEEPGAARSPIGPVAGRHPPDSVTAARGRPKTRPGAPPAREPATALAAPAAAAEAPWSDASPGAAPGPSAAVPSDEQPGENAPVPRDDIPD